MKILFLIFFIIISKKEEEISIQYVSRADLFGMFTSEIKLGHEGRKRILMPVVSVWCSMQSVVGVIVLGG
jgi:hypothetical protein